MRELLRVDISDWPNRKQQIAAALVDAAENEGAYISTGLFNEFTRL